MRRPKGRPLLSALVSLAALPVAALSVAALSVAALSVAARAADDPPRVERLAGLPARVAVLLVGDGEGGNLHLAPLALPEAAERRGKLFRVPVVFELPAIETEAPGAPIELYLYAVAEGGGVAGHLGLRLTPGEAWGGRSGVKVVDAIELPAGSYRLRFLAFADGGRRFALVERRLTIVLEEAPIAGSPRFAEPCGDWWIVGGAEPARVDGLTARPVLVGHLPARASVSWRDAGAGWPTTVRAILTSRADGIAREAAVQIVGRRELAPGEGALDLEWEFGEAPQGIYDLEIALDAVRAPAVEVWLVTAAPTSEVTLEPGCAEGWAAVAERSAAERPRPRPEVAVSSAAAPADPPGRRQAGRAYGELLRRLAVTGDLRAGADRLAAIESAYFAGAPRALAALADLELAVARRLAAVDSESLAPLFRLHSVAYRLHFEAGRFALASHSRELAPQLAELMLEGGPSPASERLVADLLTEVAVSAHRHRMAVAAVDLLERAVEIDRTHEAARLLLAALYERLGSYPEARQRLEELVALNANRVEGRVRLASLLERNGRLAESERLLRAVVRERPRDWELSIAYQTLGRVLARGGRYDEAVELLGRAVRELPGDQRVRLQFAHLLDRAGRSEEGAAILAELPIGPERSPRWRYADLEVAELERLEAAVAEQVGVRLPRLRLALEESVEVGP